MPHCLIRFPLVVNPAGSRSGSSAVRLAVASASVPERGHRIIARGELYAEARGEYNSVLCFSFSVIRFSFFVYSFCVLLSDGTM